MRQSAKYQVAINSVFAAIKAVSLLVTISMAEALLGTYVTGVVLLFRKQGAVWANIVQFGLSQTLVRYYLALQSPVERSRLWWDLVLLVLALCLAGVMLCAMFSEQVSSALLGQANGRLAIAFGIYISGIAIGYMAHSSWSAEFNFVRSNLLDWLNGSLLLIICISLFAQWNADSFVLILGASTLFSSLIFLLWFSRKNVGHLGFSQVGGSLSREHLSFGASRALMAAAESGAFLYGPWLLRETPTQAGQLIIAISLLKMVPALVLPISKVLALRTNTYKFDRISEDQRIMRLTLTSVLLCLIFVTLYRHLGEEAIALWVPASSDAVSTILNQLIMFIPGLCIFYFTKPIIDIRYKFPFSLAVFILYGATELFVNSWGDKSLTHAISSLQILMGIMTLAGLGFSANISWSLKQSK